MLKIRYFIQSLIQNNWKGHFLCRKPLSFCQLNLTATEKGIEMRIAIVGNGVIGTLTAIVLKETFPHFDICLIGELSRPGSASAGAGAMANVFAEYEHEKTLDNSMQEKYLSIGLSGRESWTKLIEKWKANQIITARDTLVFLKKAGSEFEKLNFESVIDVSKRHNSLELCDSEELDLVFGDRSLQVEQMIRLKGEFALCTIALFKLFENIISKLGIRIYANSAESITTSEVILNNGKSLPFDKCIVAAGSKSEQILNSFKIIPMLQGVGTAWVINSTDGQLDHLKNMVLRTVNRGGAQCGLHVVPRSDGTIYLGAGNYVTLPGYSDHRLETVKYLFESFQNEIIGRQVSYELTGRLSIGYRPRTIDGFPVIGHLDAGENIFVIGGTNRVGLTWAPRLVDEVINWINQKDISDNFKSWKPNRSPISFGSPESAITYFTQSRLSNALEHGLIPNSKTEIESKSNEFRNVGNELHLKTKKLLSLEDGVSINPDNWNAIISGNISC